MKPSSRCAVTWLGHATVLIELDGMRLLTDPVLRNRIGPLLRIASPGSPQTWDAIDCVLLSHLHADHADRPSLRRLADVPAVLTPRGSAEWLRRLRFRDVREMSPGDTYTLAEVQIRATPAIHDHRRRPWGVKAAPVGYLVRGSFSAYFAGDTDLFDEMTQLRGLVDVALLPVWGWGPRVGPGHLNPERAARAAALIAPRVAIPIHWGTFALAWARQRQDDPWPPAQEFAARTREYAPDVAVRLLSPGASSEF